jgi:DNA-binding transcriptional regulator YiaG
MQWALTSNYALCIDADAMQKDQIKSFRESRGLSQKELADRLGVNQATVSRIENGAVVPKPVAILLERLMSEPDAEAAA